MLGSLAFIDGEAFIPFLESFAAVLLEFLVCREKEFAGIFYRLIEFAEIVVVLATYPGPSFVDAADTMWQEVAAVCLNVQKPTIGILKYIDAFMGNLPEQVVKIFLGFRRRDLLVDRVTTNRLLTL